MKYLVLTNLLLLFSCTNVSSTGKLEEEDVVEATTQNESSNSINVENSIGVLSLNDNVPVTKNDTIKLLNDDGSLWHQFSYFYDDSDGEYDFQYDEFQPYVFHPDYFLLGLIVTEEINGDSFKVIVNQSSSLEKVIKMNEKLVLNTWEEAVLKSSSITFNASVNSVRDKQSQDSESYEIPKDAVLKPVSISEDWLKVEWTVDSEKQSGWIQWKRDGLLIIDLSFLT